jgi:hypothetical protein
MFAAMRKRCAKIKESIDSVESFPKEQDVAVNALFALDGDFETIAYDLAGISSEPEYDFQELSDVERIVKELRNSRKAKLDEIGYEDPDDYYKNA